MTDLDPNRLKNLHRYWCAANYLTIGQIYLQENPLLREPLRPEHIKPRLLGHWGTSPGLSFIYAHLNRLIQDTDANVIYLTGPGHGGPAIVANVYLEGTYSEIYPNITQDTSGLCRLFRQFSTPGGIPSHASVPTPGSINEGGELGYVLAHAFGAIFDNPDLIVVAVIGDGEAETGPLEGSWKGVKFLNPVHDGAVLPILHLNGYKISGPTVLGRDRDEDIQKFLESHGYEVHFVEGNDPLPMHQAFATTLDACYSKIRAIQTEARATGHAKQPAWPAIVLRSLKGWTGPKVVDGLPVEGTFRAHQVPLANVRDNPAHLQMLEQWMRSYRPEELFDPNGRLLPELAALAPKGDRRMAHELGCKGITVYRDGSRSGQTLSSVKPNTAQAASLNGPRARCRVTTGSTAKFRTACGTLFVTVNRDDEGLCEVFVNLNKGGCPSQSEATCRVVSAALRCGVDPKAMIEQLRGIRCLATCVARKDQKDIDVLSCPDAIARAMEEALGGAKAADTSLPLAVHQVCPQCHKPMHRDASCWRCECGYSDCNHMHLFALTEHGRDTK